MATKTLSNPPKLPVQSTATSSEIVIQEGSTTEPRIVMCPSPPKTATSATPDSKFLALLDDPDPLDFAT